MATFDRVAHLPIQVDSYALECLQAEVSSDFTRLSTVIRMSGAGEEGVGEDVTYDALDHIALQDQGPVHDLSGTRSLGELCELIGWLDRFPADPRRDVSALCR